MLQACGKRVSTRVPNRYLLRVRRVRIGEHSVCADEPVQAASDGDGGDAMDPAAVGADQLGARPQVPGAFLSHRERCHHRQFCNHPLLHIQRDADL